MDLKELKNCPNGLYRIYWKGGGTSVASLGTTYDGSRWIAPANWTHSDNLDPKIATTGYWSSVERIELIALG